MLKNSINVQKQPLDVFYQKTVLIGKKQSWSLLVTLTQLSCEYCEIFKNTYFEEHMRTAASECRIQQQ